MIIICAPNRQLAQHYARQHNLHPKAWKFLGSISDVHSTSPFDTILWITGDTAGDFTFGDAEMELLKMGRWRADKRLVQFRLAKMEDAP